MAWLASDLLTAVRRNASLPATGVSGLNDAELLASADEELQTSLVPLVMSAREEFYVGTHQVALAASVAAYRLPGRTVGGRVRDVRLIVGNVKSNLVRIEPEDSLRFVSVAAGQPSAFYLEGGNLILVPTPGSASATLEVKYYVRPGRLTVTADDFRILTAVTPDTPSAGRTRLTFASWTVPASIDALAGSSAFHTLAPAVSYANAASPATTLDVATADVPGIAVNDYLASADLSPLVQLPVELHGTLAARLEAKVLRQLGHLEESKFAADNASKLEAAALRLLSNRVDGEPRKLRGNLMWRNRFRYWGW